MAAGFSYWVAHVAFWTLLVIGWVFGDLGIRGTAVFLVLWLIAYFGLSGLQVGSELFFSFVALLDVALVFIIFKGDIRLT
jgi:hypothetical protein